jgi:hypothetical protein
MSIIITRNSATSGSIPASLVQGELAINVTDGNLFYGSGSGNVVKQFGVTSSYALNALSASYALTASFVQNAVSASYALNGGVTQLLAGPNVTLSPTNGLGQVTVSAILSGSTIFNTATGSYGSFYDTTIQTNPVANIARSMSFNSTDITNGVSISGSTSPFNTYIKTTNAGVYDIQFSAQVEKTDSGTDVIVIWLRKNGIDLTDSATKLTLSGNSTKVVAAWNWFVSSAANDYYQIIWVSADTGMRLYAEPINDTPGIPSVIATVNRVDQFLSNTGSFSGSFTGVFTGSLQGTASFATSASFASTVPASGVIGLNLSQIATGSVTASVSPTQFTVTSGSSTELVVRGTGVTIGSTITDTHTITGSLNISGSVTTTSLTSSTVLISGSGTNRLIVIGSGSAQPIFTVQGSQGELFSITDSLSGSLFSVNDISGLPILEVFSDNTTLMGSYLDPMLITTTKLITTSSGAFILYSLPTSSYDTAFFEYSIKSGSNARAGSIMAIQSGTSVNFTETTTTDFGSTSGFGFIVQIAGANMILTGSATTSGWTIKTIVRGI